MARTADARVIAEILTEAFEGYRAWAPAEWSPPPRDEGEAFLAQAGLRQGGQQYRGPAPRGATK